ncbi:MAG: hypothetical protein IMZ61_02395 [Planctomycetes bacterium]|nr:hypothetical protein [Planctomycetota bacterium]
MTLHPDRNAKELLSIYRRANRKTRQIIRYNLVMEIARRAKACRVFPARRPQLANLFFFSGLFMLCLFPILPDHLLSIPIAVGGGVSLAILGGMTSNLVLFVKSKMF